MGNGGSRPGACCGEAAGGGAADPLDLVRQQGLFFRDLEHPGECQEPGEGVVSQVSPQDLALRDKHAMLKRRLFVAVRCDDAPVILQLVADGVDLDAVGEALRLAAVRGSSAVLRELVAVGLGVNEACPHTGFTPLQLAAASGHVTACELLLDALADVHAPAAGHTPLSLARKMGHVEVEEAIERHVALLITDQGDEDGAQHRRAHVLPRVSPDFSEAVLGALKPAPGAGDAGLPFALGHGPGNRAVAALPQRGCLGHHLMPQVLPL